MNSGIVMVSFDKEFREVSEKISFHATEIDHIANAVNIAESRKAREHEEAFRQGELFIQCTISYLVEAH